MRAIVCQQYSGPEVMHYAEIPEPEPAAGEVLIPTEAIGVIGRRVFAGKAASNAWNAWTFWF